MKNIFAKISTWNTESQMGLALAIIPSIIYMVSKMLLILA
jgi:flagellar biogenesis protein FliO